MTKEYYQAHRTEILARNKEYRERNKAALALQKKISHRNWSEVNE